MTPISFPRIENFTINLFGKNYIRDYIMINSDNSFRRAEGGNVATLTAVALLVLVGAVALSLDISKGSNTKSRLANTADALSLALARSREKNPSEMQRIALNFLEENSPEELRDQVEIISLTWDGDAVTVRLSDVSKNAFGDFLGNGTVTNVSVESTAVFTRKIMDIALVLDSTGSMSLDSIGGGKKIDVLKTGANEMVDVIDEYADTNVRISVVPFSVYVNIGIGNRNKTWSNVLPDRNHRSARAGRAATETDPGVPSVSEIEERKFIGCIGSRLPPYNLRAGFDGRQIPAVYQTYRSSWRYARIPNCPAEILQLTTNFGSVKSKINSLVPSGNTYIPAGLMWGWRTLDDNDPYSHSSDKKTEKILVLMTDGENTVGKNGVLHDTGGNVFTTNSDTSSICQSIKNEDITVYTIAYEVNDTTTQNMLKGCATESSQYYNARNAKELRDAFEDIANSLIEVRISA